MIGAITKRVTKSSVQTQQQQDENKAAIIGKTTTGLGDKKIAQPSNTSSIVTTKRSALGDISNVPVTSNGTTKVEKKTSTTLTSLAGRVRVPTIKVAEATKTAVVVPLVTKPATANSQSIPPTVANAPPAEKELAVQECAVVIVPVTSEVAAAVQQSKQIETTIPKQVDPMVIDSEDEEEEEQEEDPNEPEDIDMYDANDPQCCTEYVMDIFAYCRKKEVVDAVNPNYMKNQNDISEKMRGVLVDWMVEVNLKYKLLTETMFLSVNLVDRYLEKRVIPRAELQLVGVTSMLLASKYEEIYAPEIKKFTFCCDEAYSHDDILRMERQMLSTLSFNLSVPTPLHFLRRFSKAARSDSRIHTLSKYLTELSLPEYKMIQFLPSVIAAAAVFLARQMLGVAPTWTPTLIKYTTYQEKEVINCARELNTITKKASTSAILRATYNKYKNEKLLSVAKIPPCPDF